MLTDAPLHRAVAGREQPRRRSAAMLTLGFEDRRRSRHAHPARRRARGRRCCCRAGRSLRDGDRLRVARTARRGDGARGAAQTLSRVRTEDALLLARAAYHLGNRHIRVQIGRGRLRTSTTTCSTAWSSELGLAVNVQRALRTRGRAPYGAHEHSTDATRTTRPRTTSTDHRRPTDGRRPVTGVALLRLLQLAARRCRSARSPIRRGWNRRSRPAG